MATGFMLTMREELPAVVMRAPTVQLRKCRAMIADGASTTRKASACVRGPRPRARRAASSLK